ncbi:response regulator [Paenibacillus antri]|uniref:Response regulator n=1 Tax=Paenibacillus antri TaxID=2582848 RepID=A0A5R9G8L9_9BACL|nr:response regulator [Paenibacillus antri]TLS49738.1 response regulator [Paenibacillus antri]
MNMRAIILDDEPLSLAGMERMLRRQGVDVLGAFSDPREALLQAESLAADVAFVDIEMPGMNGIVAAERLLARLPDVQIVFVTAYDQYAVNAFELNATDYLLKPVQTKRLETTLARLASRMPRPSGADETEEKRAAPALRCFLRLSAGASEGEERALEIPWRTTKAKEVFSYLLHMRDRAVSKDALLDLMWPEMDLLKAQTHLHTTVYQIRQTVKGLSLPIKLSFVDGGYRLELHGVAVDVDLWERKLADLVDKDPLPIEELQRWMALYRGDYFEQEGYLWAEQERERLRMKWLESALRFAGELGGRSWSSVAYSLLTDVIARFPSVQESYSLLMRMFHRQGQAQEVRRTYAQMREALREEAGEEPEAGIAAWYEEHYGRA